MKGFTLIELLIGLAVLFLGIMAGWAALNPEAVQKAREESRKDCSYYGDEILENVPARCIKYFQKGGE